MHSVESLRSYLFPKLRKAMALTAHATLYAADDSNYRVLDSHESASPISHNQIPWLTNRNLASQSCETSSICSCAAYILPHVLLPSPFELLFSTSISAESYLSASCRVLPSDSHTEKLTYEWPFGLFTCFLWEFPTLQIPLHIIRPRPPIIDLYF